MSLQITTIYESIQGESTYAGKRCVFVRTTGCPLRCRWCDTSYAFTGGTAMSLDEIMAKVHSYASPLVEVTGGEPLAQPATLELMDRLIHARKQVMIETSGSIDIAPLQSQVHIIMDLKCPDSGMSTHNRWENLDHLKATDEIKFVIASHRDFEWAVKVVKDRHLLARAVVLFSVAFGQVKPAELSKWILSSGLDVRLNLQLHKFIWNPRAKDV